MVFLCINEIGIILVCNSVLFLNIILWMFSHENNLFLSSFLLSPKNCVVLIPFWATRKVLQWWNSHNFVKYIYSFLCWISESYLIEAYEASSFVDKMVKKGNLKWFNIILENIWNFCFKWGRIRQAEKSWKIMKAMKGIF